MKLLNLCKIIVVQTWASNESADGYSKITLTQLKYQNSENRLKDEPQVGTPIRQRLSMWVAKFNVSLDQC